jgi:hypothetical protein
VKSSVKGGRVQHRPNNTFQYIYIYREREREREGERGIIKDTVIMFEQVSTFPGYAKIRRQNLITVSVLKS